MLGILRKQKILQLINQYHQVSVQELATLLKVTTNTIRVDLRELQANGEIIRVWGGVISSSLSIDSEDQLSVRGTQNLEAKQHIAQKVIDALPKKERLSIFLDSSTTCFEVVKLLKTTKKKLIVITNFYKIALELNHNPSITVILSGGVWWSQEFSCIGNDALSTLQHYRVDLALISCAGIDIKDGIFNGNFETTPIKQLMQKNSTETWLLCDNSKFDTTSLSHMFDISQINKLFTNHTISSEWQEYCSQHNISVIL
ncbi:MAG: DeoR/GlpR family DNA-binding transcription regulator [Brevinema sp.]